MTANNYLYSSLLQQQKIKNKKIKHDIASQIFQKRGQKCGQGHINAQASMG